MRNFLHHTVDTVFIMLGSQCNLACRYCLQHPLKAKRDPAPMKEDAIAFLQNAAGRQQEPLGIHFYGGEPFLFRKEMEAIVNALRGEPNVAFSVITNGTLIDEETAAWCNEAGIHVLISWDGPGSMQTRGIDVFAGANRGALLSIKRLGVSAVVSAYAYPLEIVDAYAELDREYYALHGHNMPLNVDEIMDTGLADKSLLAIDLDRVRRDMETIAGECKKLLHGEENEPWRAHMGQDYVNKLRDAIRGMKTFERGVCSCGNGVNILNMDLQGNLYRCHNTDQVVGTVRDHFAGYLSKLMLLDPTRENSRRCKDCPVVSLCNCGCPLIGPEAREATYCRLKRAMFEPVVNLVLCMGEETSPSE